MKDGKCPLCGSINIYTNPNLTYSIDGDNLSLSDDRGRESILFSFTPYICLSCGYSTLFIADMADVKDLPGTKGWMKVG